MIGFAILICVCIASLCRGDNSASGAIVSAQFMCVAPCRENWSLDITRTNFVNQIGVDNDVVLQQLLPGAPAASREFPVYTAFDTSSRSFAVVAAEYPLNTGATFWVSTVNNDITSATPVYTQIAVDYPVSSSPYPLNVAHLKISRIFYGPLGTLYVGFSNGEVHTLDLGTKTFKQVFSLISDEKQLSNSFPTTTWSQVYDSESNVLWSVVFQGVNAYVVKGDLNTNTVGDWVQLKQVDGLEHVGFAPETFINAHMLKVNESEPARLAIAMESLPNLGFDEINYIDTTTGQMIEICGNLMEYNVLLSCPQFECDKWRVSAYDPVGKKLYFQGHLIQPDGTQVLSLMYVYFSVSKITGQYESVIAPAYSLSYGYTGMEYVPFI